MEECERVSYNNRDEKETRELRPLAELTYVKVQCLRNFRYGFGEGKTS